MPLTYPVKPKRKMFNNVSNVVYQTLARLNPDVIVLLFLIATVAFRHLPTAFYVVFALFVAGYFGERIIKIIQKNAGVRDTK